MSSDTEEQAPETEERSLEPSVRSILEQENRAIDDGYDYLGTVSAVMSIKDAKEKAEDIASELGCNQEVRLIPRTEIVKTLIGQSYVQQRKFYNVYGKRNS